MAKKNRKSYDGATSSKGRARSSMTGRFVGKSYVQRHPASTKFERVVRATPNNYSVVRSSSAVTKGTPANRRSLPADDPLAPERTRWLASVVGGGGRLAEMLGVSASQTSRWAKGQERPGPTSAPLLIDLEHVLARTRLVWSEPAATTWLTSANAHLSGARPIDVLALRGVGPVLEALDAGAWGSAA